MHDCLKNKPIQKWEQMRKRFWLFAKRLKSLDCMGFHFLQEGMEPWILILFFKKKNDENTDIWKGRTNFLVKFALRIEVEILLVAERVEAKKDWNEKPGKPFGENALIFFYFSFSLSWNKESKFKAVSNHAKNIRLSNRRFELAALKHQIVFAPACAFDAPLFFTHHLIRPCKKDIQILKILNHFRMTWI